MKHNKISKYLKGIDITIAIVIVIMVGVLSWLKLNPPMIEGMFMITGMVTLPILYLLALAALFVLYEFWSVCSEIGKDNSFSQENAKSFHHMSMAGLAVELILIIKIIIVITSGQLSLPTMVCTFLEMLVAAIFMILCECLSKLIQNAYEMKYENDLTI